MSTLYERLAAAVDAAEASANAEYGTPRGAITVNASGWPAFVLRGIAEDREVLKRHAPEMYGAEGELRYYVCTGEHRQVTVWARCPEVLSVARRHGVPIEEP